ncbi:MAG: hypothetical protein K2K76_10310 [Muribaculaceae bacterium]|nr:hypothetical protein [Muribaculaceae bacterium]
MEEKIQFSIDDLLISHITESDYESLSLFSCGNDEIDDFFHDEVRLCSKYSYLIPYKCTIASSGEIAGVFTLANDVLNLEYEDKISFYNIAPEYSEIFIRQTSYPAINIGHLGVRSDLQSRGIGRFIVEFVRMTFASSRIAGCQFITVDALNNHRTTLFYTDKIGFEFQTLGDLGHHTRRMYLDIFTHPSS